MMANPWEVRQVSPKPLLTNALPRRVLIKVSLQIINFYKQRKFRSARKDGFKFTGGWMKPPPAHPIPSPLCPAPARCQGLALPQQSSPHHLKSLAAHQLSAFPRLPCTCWAPTPLYTSLCSSPSLGAKRKQPQFSPAISRYIVVSPSCSKGATLYLVPENSTAVFIIS